MIATTLTFLYLFLICFGIGVISIVVMMNCGVMSRKALSRIAIDHIILFGWLILTVLLGVFSIFYKIGLLANVGISAIVLIGFVYFRDEVIDIIKSGYHDAMRSGSRFYWLAAWPVVGILILYSIGPIQGYDPRLYHAQAIQWIQSYPAVPGLVWIHSRLAFNSHLFLSEALFSMSFLNFGDSAGVNIVLYPVNGFLYFLLLCRTIFKIAKGFRENEILLPTIYAITFLTSFLCFGRSIQSPTPDITVAILIFYLFFAYLETGLLFGDSNEFSFEEVFILLIVLSLATIKVAAAFLIIFLAIIYWKRPRSLKTIIVMLILCLVIYLPFFARNIILSGYIVYPFHQMDMFHVDWKYSINEVIKDSNVIRSWARVNKSSEIFLHVAYKDWVPIWWSIYNRDINRMLIIISIISPLVMIMSWLLQKDKISKTYRVAYLVLVFNVLIWFLLAPDPRFAWGILCFNAALTTAVAVSIFGNRLKWAIKFTLFGLMVWMIQYHQEHWAYMMGTEFMKSVKVYPVQMENVELDKYTIDNKLELLVPKNGDDRCFNAKIPCAPTPLPHVHMRGETIEDGFYAVSAKRLR
ncbi:MAG: hypothetical protein JST14_12890 [Bacteroidetes bacterium]|nr:hypothetical protein [Bacteroidota bacterium]